MKRRSALLGAVAAVSLLAACSSTDPAGPATTEPGTPGTETTTDDAPGEKVELEFAIFSEDQRPAIEQVVAAFEDENPDIDVTLQVIPWVDYWNTLQTIVAGGTGPDVAWMLGARLGPYLDGQVLLPLDDAIAEAGIDTAGYPEALVSLYRHDGATYALPKDFDTIGLWYNKALFDAAGLEHPNPDWTWQDVVDNAVALTDPDAGTYGFAAPLEAQAGYYNTIYQAGGYVISQDGTTSGYDLPASIEGLEFWTDMIHEHRVSPSLASFADTEAVAQFISGNIAMMYTGSFFALRFANDEYASANFDVTELPAGPANDATIINGLGNVAFANSDHPEEAARLAVFLSSPTASEIQSATGAVLGSYEGTQQAWVDAFPQFNVQVFLDMVPGSVVYPVSGDTDAWASREGELLTPAWTGEQSVADAAAALAAVMNEALAQEQG